MKSAVPLPVAAAPHAADHRSGPYVSYAYSYPHKSAYGPLDPPVPLLPLWQAERRDALFLYVHIPFCEMRCGFCNLFARASSDETLVKAYLDGLAVQAQVLAEAIAGDRAIARFAIGGGTPTYLTASQLERVFDVAERHFGASPRGVPTSVEVSPKTALPDRLRVLRERGVGRVSIGVQSFRKEETQALGRPQHASEVHAALDRLRAFPTLNIDLIYGQPGQTVETWRASIRAALHYRPEEIYLYPLYVRPGTGIARRGTGERLADGEMRRLYREGRDLLRSRGYDQVSMRYFRLGPATCDGVAHYCCQRDGMLGLGCGARSYTRALHYASRFAVETAGVQAILNQWINQSAADFAMATWGCRLSEEDRRRRFVIQSLLTAPGLGETDFRKAFGLDLVQQFPLLNRLAATGLVSYSERTWRLTALGLEWSDGIGPAFYAPARRATLEQFAHG